jgi:ABC-type glycerol-3-phosphate transport system substrate-binding protein
LTKVKKWIVVFMSCVVLVLALAILSMATFQEKKAAAQPKYSYANATAPVGGIVVDAGQTEGSAASAVVSDWEGRQSVLKWSEGTSGEWTFDVPQAGQYELSLAYYPLDGNSQDIEFSLWLDGKSLYESDPFTLNRVWRDETSVMQAGGNQLRPKQVEEKLWLNKKLDLPEESGGGPLRLELSAGKHTLKLENTRESAMLDGLQFSLVQQLPNYKEYRETIGSPAADNVPEGTFEQIQGEFPYLKSTAGLFPTVDRSSPLTEPYNPVNIRMNTIGGSNWDVSGQWISWKLDAPASGWYTIGMRVHQNKVKGSFVSRKVYLDGAVPFSELEKIRFNYDTSWQIKELGDEQESPYLFYLTKGEHELKMEVVLGDLAKSVQNVQKIVYDLNQLYRKIVMITGVTPDPYRDYELDKSIPELPGEFTRLSAMLKSEAGQLDELSGQSSTGSSTLEMLALQLDSFVSRPDGIPKRLDSYKSNVTALADWLLSIKSQPLEIDYLYTASPDLQPPQAEANFAQRVLHELRTFTGSFMQNYDSLSADSEDKSGDNLDVWIGLGRDQAYVLNRMIEDSFTPETGIHVDLNLVKDALVKAVMAGVGPDINLFTNRGDTMNLAIRGALEPLDQQEGFAKLPTQYMPSAFVPYQYEGHTYAIPDEQQFLVMFTRDDVLKELGLEAPETWDDLLKIAPVLQNHNLQIGLPYESLDAYGLLNQGMGMLNLLPTLLMQNGSGIYNEAHTATRFNEPSAYKAFKQWTDFYNLYDYPLYKNDFNRFWTGEMPVVITSYKLYNQLVAVAPEIDRTWSMRHIPGTRQSDGTLNYASAANGTAGIILKKTKDKEAAWKFMQWWNSPEVQNRFVAELENELGLLGRRTPANVEAFAATNWTRAEQKVLMDQWKQVQEVPELPGGYYTSRNIDNAFRSVVFQWENPREALYYWNKQINEEIIRKRYEFGVKE